MSHVIDQILNEVCLDERIPDGVFDMSNNAHMDALRENLTDKYGVALNDVKMIHNKMVEGKYPERQAYNKDGLLVTFPTPQHKQRAIQRGTHFEQDPSKGQQNVFGGGQQAGQASAAPAASAAQTGQSPAGGAPDIPQQNVFTPPPAPATPAAPSGQSASSALPASDAPQATPAAPSAPSGQSAPSSLPASDQPQPSAASDQQGLAVEPPAPAASAPTAPAPPPNFDSPKPPEQRAAEAQAVKQIMKGDDTNPTLNPVLNEQNRELILTYYLAEERGYKQAMKILKNAMNKK